MLVVQRSGFKVHARNPHLIAFRLEQSPGLLDCFLCLRKAVQTGVGRSCDHGCFGNLATPAGVAEHAAYFLAGLQSVVEAPQPQQAVADAQICLESI